MGKTAIAIKLEQKRYDHCPNYGPVFFLFVFVSIYDSIFAFDRVWSSRQLEIKVWELSPRARGGLLTITVLKNCYVFSSFWVPFNYFPFPQNANNFSITGKQETGRRRESSATGERTKRERDQRKKACRGNQPSLISTLGTCGKVANYMSLTLDLIVDLKTNKGRMYRSPPLGFYSNSSEVVACSYQLC